MPPREYGNGDCNVKRGAWWGCPDLTDTGLGTKRKEPHEDPDAEAVCWKVALQCAIQAGCVGALEEQRSQRGPSRSGARDPGTAFVSLGQAAPAGRSARTANESRKGVKESKRGQGLTIDKQRSSALCDLTDGAEAESGICGGVLPRDQSR